MAHRRTKIVATVGPACDRVETLVGLISAGVNVFRLNMAHGSVAAQTERVKRIREAGLEAQRPVAILADLAGPKLRLGQLAQTELECEPGDKLILKRGGQASSPDELVTDYAALLDEIHAGDKIVIGDGTIALEVVQTSSEEAQLLVLDGGTIRSRQGIALPHTQLSVQTIGPEDYEHATWASQQGVDFISLSFVREASDLRELREHVRRQGSHAAIIAKIEKRESLDRLEEIVQESDGIMVARGDLGLEVDIATTAVVQKRIIETCRRHNRPVIVATQMLESMHNAKRPTRAEVSDVSNAILDGADACMLSGETAIGKYPIETVQMMARIQWHAEQLIPPMRLSDREHYTAGEDVTEAVLQGAAHIARSINSKVVVIATKESGPAILKSKLRDRTPTLCVTDSPILLGQGCLWWGVTPWLVDSIEDENKLFEAILQWNGYSKLLESGDRVVIVSDRRGFPAGHDDVLIYEVP